jgi:integrase
MPICSELDSELRVWLEHYTLSVGELSPHYFLVPARWVSPIIGEGGRIVGHDAKYRPEKRLGAAGKIVTPILGEFGLPIRDENDKPLMEGAHTIRRSGARALFDSLVDGGYDHALRLVQSMLHHSSMQMTEHYLGITADRRSRDEIIRGKRMYVQTAAGNVVSIAR